MTDLHVEVIDAQLELKPVVRQLLELYLHDFSEFMAIDVDASGSFGYPYLDNYWTDDDRRPFLFRVNEQWAGFALVRTGAPHDMAEFFVMRRYRRGGIGRDAARTVFERVPGDWQVRQMATNPAATAFWRRIIPFEFEDSTNDDGPVQRFSTV